MELLQLLLFGLAFIFVTLKILHKIDWSWSAVLATIWVPAFIALIFRLVITVVGA